MNRIISAGEPPISCGEQQITRASREQQQRFEQAMRTAQEPRVARNQAEDQQYLVKPQQPLSRTEKIQEGRDGVAGLPLSSSPDTSIEGISSSSGEPQIPLASREQQPLSQLASQHKDKRQKAGTIDPHTPERPMLPTSRQPMQESPSRQEEAFGSLSAAQSILNARDLVQEKNKRERPVPGEEPTSSELFVSGSSLQTTQELMQPLPVPPVKDVSHHPDSDAGTGTGTGTGTLVPQDSQVDSNPSVPDTTITTGNRAQQQGDTPRTDSGETTSLLAAESEETTQSREEFVAVGQQLPPPARTPGDLLLARVSPAQSNPELGRLLERLAVDIHLELGGPDRPPLLRLNLPALGDLAIRIAHHGGELQIEIQASSQGQLLLNQGRSELFDRLQRLYPDELVRLDLFSQGDSEQGSRQQRSIYEEWDADA